MRIGLYPGTFDPITLGHIDIIRRGAMLVDRLVIGVAINRDKGPMFSLEERVAMIEAECAVLSEETGTEIVPHPFENLLIDCAHEVGAQVIVRGLRAVADFEYEFQMAQMNRHLDSSLETIFLMPNEKYFYTSSQLIKQVHLFGKRETDLVPENVLSALRKINQVGRGEGLSQ